MNKLVINLTMVALYWGCKYCTAYMLTFSTLVQWLVWLLTLPLIFWLPCIPHLPKLQMFLLLSLLLCLPRLPLAGGAIFTRVLCRLFYLVYYELVTRSSSDLASNHILLTTITNTCTNNEKAKCNLSVSGIMTYRGRRGTAPLILIIRTRWSWVINYLNRPLYSKERNRVTIEREVQLTPELVWMLWRSIFSVPGYELRSVQHLALSLYRLRFYGLQLFKQINVPLYLRPKTKF